MNVNLLKCCLFDSRKIVHFTDDKDEVVGNFRASWQYSIRWKNENSQHNSNASSLLLSLSVHGWKQIMKHVIRTLNTIQRSQTIFTVVFHLFRSLASDPFPAETYVCRLTLFTTAHWNKFFCFLQYNNNDITFHPSRVLKMKLPVNPRMIQWRPMYEFIPSVNNKIFRKFFVWTRHTYILCICGNGFAFVHWDCVHLAHAALFKCERQLWITHTHSAWKQIQIECMAAVTAEASDSSHTSTKS